MEEFLKSYFVQHKQLIFEKLGILTLNVSPAYFDKQHQQLFPTYFNYSFTPSSNAENDKKFFDALSYNLNISNHEAEQIYKNFVSNLKIDFEKKSSFTISNFLTVSHVNNAYLVEIDSNLQMVFNPIPVNNKNKKQKVIVSSPYQSQYKSPAIEKILPVVTPKKSVTSLANEKKETQIHISKSIKPKATQTRINSVPEKKQLRKKDPVGHSKKNNQLSTYWLIIIVMIAIALLILKFFIFNNTMYFSSLWK